MSNLTSNKQKAIEALSMPFVETRLGKIYKTELTGEEFTFTDKYDTLYRFKGGELDQLLTLADEIAKAGDKGVKATIHKGYTFDKPIVWQVWLTAARPGNYSQCQADISLTFRQKGKRKFSTFCYSSSQYEIALGWQSLTGDQKLSNVVYSHSKHFDHIG